MKEIFDSGVNDLWQRSKKDYPVIGVRDRRYLEWRFLCRPDVQYRLLEAFAGKKMVGYLVLRSHIRKGRKIGYLVDYLVDGGIPGIMRALVRAAIASFRREGVGIIGCRATPLSYRQLFYRLGFFPLPWMSPAHFHPRDAAGDEGTRAFRNPSNWFLTMGDGDFETAF
jgi:hypothetical protein